MSCVCVVYVCVHAKTRLRVFLVKIEILHMVHDLCERHQLLQWQFPFPFLLQDIEILKHAGIFINDIIIFISWYNDIHDYNKHIHSLMHIQKSNLHASKRSLTSMQ